MGTKLDVRAGKAMKDGENNDVERVCGIVRECEDEEKEEDEDADEEKVRDWVNKGDGKTDGPLTASSVLAIGIEAEAFPAFLLYWGMNLPTAVVN